MAELIELSTPERYVAKGKSFRDWTLDVQSIQDNCKRIAGSLSNEDIYFVSGTGSRRAPTPAEVLDQSKGAIGELGKIVTSHRGYMDGLGGGRP